MIELKRKLFPESSTGLIPDDVIWRGSKQKRNAPGPRQKKEISTVNGTISALLVGDRLASIPQKIRKEKRQRSANMDNGLEHSVLMVLNGKENIKSKKGGRSRRKAKNQQKNQTKTGVTALLEKRDLSSNLVRGGMLTSLEVTGRSRSRCQSRSLASNPTLSKPRRRGNAKKTTQKMNLTNSTDNNGDSLLFCLPNSLTTNKHFQSKTTLAQNDSKRSRRTEILDKKQERKTSKPSKPSTQRILQIAKSGNYFQSSVGEPSRQIPMQEKKPLHRTKDKTKRSQETCGLGAFVAIIAENKTNQCSRFVSPLENSVKNNSILSLNEQGSASSFPVNTTKMETIGMKTTTLSDIPNFIIVPISQQIEPSLETADVVPNEFEKKDNTAEAETNASAAKVYPKDWMISSKKVHRNKTRLKHKNRAASPQSPREIEHEANPPKYAPGTKFVKHFPSHGLFFGKIVAFEPESSLYNVYYEDGDSEDLEESELDECKILSTSSVFGEDGDQEQLKTISILHKTEEKSSKNVCSDSKGNRTTDASNNEESNSDCDPSKSSDKKIQSKISEKNKLTNNQNARTSSRESRRQSRETHRKLFSVESSSHKGDKKSFTRRSKRRRSQPIRLIDSSCSKDQRETRSNSRKKRKVSHQKGANEIVKEHKIGEDTTSRGDELLTSSQNQPLLPSDDVQKCMKKKHVDDALRAVMPEGNQGQLTGDSDQTEDDIFNSTPMRKLFTRSGSNDTKSNEKEEHEQEEGKKRRRSKRKSIEPERYGKFANSASKSSEKQIRLTQPLSKSAEKKMGSVSRKEKNKPRVKSKAKKRVRIVNEQPEESDAESCSASNTKDPWTETDLKTLHKAHRTADPTSFTFWEDVAERVGEKSSRECREKWFSLAKTPEPKKSKAQKQNKVNIISTGHPLNADDDIFNSTPMRSVFGIGENINASAIEFEELGDISNMNFGSSIKIHNLNHNDDNILPPTYQVSSYPHGYKTYIQNIGRSMRQRDSKKKIKSCGNSSYLPPLKLGRKVAECVHEGDVEVKGRLSPGGTLHVDTLGNDDNEDYLDDDVEDEL